MDQLAVHSSALSRRAFVGRLAAVAGALGASLLAACQSAAPAPAAPTSAAVKPAAPTQAAAAPAAATPPAAAPAAKPTAAAAAAPEKLGSQLIGKLEGPEIMVSAGRPAKLVEAPML